MTHLLLALALMYQLGGTAASPGPQPGSAQETTSYKTTGTRFAVGQDVRVAADEEIRDAVAVIGGSLEVQGRVRNGVLVVGGDLHLAPTAAVEGDVLLVGGTLFQDRGARLSGSVSYLSLGEWSRSTKLPDWRPRLEVGGSGSLLGLVATVFRVGLVAALMIVVLLTARTPVARVGRAAAAEPVRAAIIGLAAEVLFLPLLLVFSVGLGITIIGLPFVFLLVPLAVLLAVVALLLGYTALACRVGEWLEDRLGWRPRGAYLATAMGLFLILAPTLLGRLLGVAPGPLRLAAVTLLTAGVLAEFMVWTIGLGATLMTGFGRWNTAPPPLEARAGIG